MKERRIVRERRKYFLSAFYRKRASEVSNDNAWFALVRAKVQLSPELEKTLAGA